jgi:very-short-patch-repair endonuclease
MSDDSQSDKLEFARQLRQNLTCPEWILWSRLRNRGFGGLKFVRQAPVGAYVVDFLCREHFLVIELDGASHDDKGAYDRVRETRLREAGFRVLRFANDDVLQDPVAVLEGTLKELLPK